MKLHIIASALPPKLDGIGDYTANLATELAKSADVTVLTGTKQSDPIPSLKIETAFSASDPSSVRQIAQIVARDQPDWVLLQYNPFCYGRWGLNLYLPEVMRRLRRVSPSTRLAVMVHEPFVPLTTPKFVVMATWQRWQLWRLGQAADMLFFSIEAWQRQFQSWFPGKPVLHLPVGSNIPHVPIRREDARARLGIHEDAIVLGLFGTASSGRMLDWTKTAIESLRTAGVPVQLLYVGPDKSAICAALGSEDIIADGPFPAEEVSRRLAAMDIYLAAYVDGVSTRRGAFLAALQHGIATVGTRGPLTDSLLERAAGQAFHLVDISNPDQFTRDVIHIAKYPALRKKMGLAGQNLYNNAFSWNSIVSHLLSALNKTSK